MPSFKPASLRIMINIGCLFDIPTGTYVMGKYGDMILNGGLSTLTGLVGIGNNFKSTILDYMQMTAMARMKDSKGTLYDTEDNVIEDRKRTMAQGIREFFGQDIIDIGRYRITSDVEHTGNEWYEIHRTYLKEKRKNAAKLSVETPFMNSDRSENFRIIMPTFTGVDSFSEFKTEDVLEMGDKNELGESGGNTIHMRQGLAKLRFLMDAPNLNGAAYNYLLMTAHLGKESTMQNAGPAGSVPIQKLRTLKNGDKIKGVTDKFTFITHNCYNCHNASPMMAKDLKGPEYPRDANDKMRMDTDLNKVSITNLRGKSGPSGMPLTIVVSQSEGVLPSLTEFNHIREQDYYGLEGGNVSYAMSLYPNAKFGRTTVRSMIDADQRFRRALNITSEMCQMSYLWHSVDEYMCTPKELYDDIKALGYDWDDLLNTRPWWTINDYDHPVPRLTTLDLLRMRKGKYHPYWMDENKKRLPKYNEDAV